MPCIALVVARHLAPHDSLLSITLHHTPGFVNSGGTAMSGGRDAGIPPSSDWQGSAVRVSQRTWLAASPDGYLTGRDHILDQRRGGRSGSGTV